ncbi:MAG: DUF362 domain-containing protein [Candidatus Aminicenantes bacterium]|nr:MAG: DUF362 domain-containing protein [Candidatus Aminicenantes bacterium]
MPSKVFFLPASEKEDHRILAEKTKRIFGELGLEDSVKKDSFVGIKIHFGEKGNTGFIKPPWLKHLIDGLKKKQAKIFLTDTNTLYLGNRSNSVEHLRLAAQHGFSLEALGVPVIIADGLIGKESGEVEVNLKHVKSAKIASTFFHTDLLLSLSHFTGHILSGFGATIKNLGMGCASRAGKLEQHSDVHPWVKAKVCTNCSVCLEYCPANAIEQADGSARIIDEKCIGCGECLVVCNVGAIKMRWDGDTLRVQEKMAEYALAVLKSVKNRAGFINYLVKITKDCDCMSKNGKLLVPDLGIVASLDPVAVDKASVDLLIEANKKDFLRDAIDVDWSAQLCHGEKIGLGSMEYELENLL